MNWVVFNKFKTHIATALWTMNWNQTDFLDVASRLLIFPLICNKLSTAIAIKIPQNSTSCESCCKYLSLYLVKTLQESDWIFQSFYFSFEIHRRQKKTPQCMPILFQFNFLLARTVFDTTESKKYFEFHPFQYRLHVSILNFIECKYVWWPINKTNTSSLSELVIGNCLLFVNITILILYLQVAKSV